MPDRAGRCDAHAALTLLLLLLLIQMCGNVCRACQMGSILRSG